MVEDSSSRLVVGKITGAFGVKGWLKVHSFTEPEANILDYQPWYIQDGVRWKPLEIDQFRMHAKGLVVHVVGCDDRDQAQLLTRLEISCDAGVLPATGEREFYWRQLQGLEVVVQQEDGTALLGKIDHLFDTGANDVMVVRPTAESMDRRERLIPWILDRFVLDVDPGAQRVLVDWDPNF